MGRTLQGHNNNGDDNDNYVWRFHYRVGAKKLLTYPTTPLL